jgi:hypothetical protein
VFRKGNGEVDINSLRCVVLLGEVISLDELGDFSDDLKNTVKFIVEKW